MADQEFKAQITGELDLSEAKSKMDSFLNEDRKVKVDVEINQNSAKKLANDIENGLKKTKIDTSALTKSLADSMNISDKSVIKKLQSQMDSMLDSLARSWNGKDFVAANAKDFFAGVDPMMDLLTKNAKLMNGRTGEYDAFYDQYKNKKIFVSDALKDAMNPDDYTELLRNNVGKIVRDATKGMSIDSIWETLVSDFPDKFSADMDNQADQIKHFFDMMRQAREDMEKVLSFNDMSPMQQMDVTDFSAEQVINATNQMHDMLQKNIQDAAEISKTQIQLDLDVNVNADKIRADIQSALQSAAGAGDENVKFDFNIDSEQLVSEMRSAINKVSSGDEPVQVDIQINRESLQSDLNTALNDIDVPIHLNVDAIDLENQIRAAVNNINGIGLNLNVNTGQTGVNIPMPNAGNTVPNTNIPNVVAPTVVVPNTGNTSSPNVVAPHVNIPNTGNTNTPNIPNVNMPNMSGLTQLQQLLQNTNRAGRQTQNVFSSMGDSFREAIATFSMADLITDGIYRVGDAVRSAADTVKEFNAIETDLSMATGKNRAYTKGLMEDYNALGQEIGAITSDVAKSADSWLRQGRSMSETNQLIKDSMVLAKDSGLDTEQASKILTSTLNGYQLAADQASRVNDILTSIDLKAAADAGGIGEALSRTASMANNVGVSLEKTAAIIATVKDVTQQSDASIGTSIRSLFSRMNNIKVGKFVDEESGEALNDVEKVLNKVGIAMRDTNGQFIDSEQILDNVAAKWTKFDKVTQKAIATAMAGTRQQNSFFAMMDNWDKVQMLTETALTSQGTAQKKFEDNYLTSLEAKTNALKASLENLSTELIPEDMFGGLLDGSKAIIDFVANTDLLQSALAGLGAAGGVFAVQQLVGAFRDLSDFSAALDLSKVANMSDDMFNSLLNLSQGLSRSQTKLLLTSTALTDAQKMAILMNQGMSAAEAQSALATMGLATAQGTATATTFSLTGALQGLWATLMANPLILVAAGVMAAVSAFSAYKRSVEEAVSSAKKAGNAWSEDNSSLQENIDRITELREALASGTLSEEEAYDAKSELLSIQESLSESYGKQVAGIDLVNGSLTEQIGLLEQVSRKEADRFLNENEKGINKATKEMTKTLGGDGGFFSDPGEVLGLFTDDGSDEVKRIKGIVEKYKDSLFMDDMGNGEFRIRFVGDATDATEVLNDVMTDIRGIEKEVEGGVQLGTLFDGARVVLEDANEIIDEYGDLYNQAQKAMLVEDKELFKADGKEQTAVKWLKDYTDAVKEYNTALSEGDTDKIAEAEAKFTAVDNAVQALLKNSDMSDYADQFGEVREQLNEAAIAAHTFNEALAGKDSSKFGKGVKKDAEALKELNLTDTDFKYAFETDGIQDGEDAINGLVDAALECGLISDTSAEQVNKLVNMLVSLGYISSGTGAAVDTVTDAVSDLSAEISNAQTALKGITTATGILTSQSTGKSISLEDFNSEELQDYTSALEYNNGALQLNTDKVRELQQAKADEAIATNDAAKAQKQSEYMENIRQIEQLQDQLRGLSDAKGEQAQTIQNSIDALLGENDVIVDQCSQLDILSASLREATGAYQNWLDKQNGSEKGDMFDDALGAIQHIEDTTQNTESEFYGRTGRESYKAAVEFIVPESIDASDAAAVSSYMDSIEGYFLHDDSGNKTGLDVTQFCQNAVDQGLMVIDEASGEYKVAGQTTMQDFADGLNLSLPMVQAMFGEMEEFDAHFDWGDEAIQTLGDMAVAAGEAKGRIEELSGDTDMNIQIDVSDIEKTEDKVSTLENTISQMQDYKGTVGLDASQVEDANAVIQYCVTQKQMLEAPAVMTVDASQVQGELGNALSLLQQFQDAKNNVEMQAAVGADTTEAQGKVDSLVAEIQGMNPEIKATLGINGESEASITASIQALTPEVMVKAGVDDALVTAWAGEEKQSTGTVAWNNDTGKVDAWAAEMHMSKGTVTWGNNVAAVKTSFTATGVVNWVNSNPPSGGTVGLNGTAHAAGTAKTYGHLVGHANASGNWGTKTGGTTLVGELGREIVVNPYTGTWESVGDNGAEFKYIPKGSIVFNHLQTESLLERGFVNSRGKANVSGTALVTGGIPIKNANVASKQDTVVDTAVDKAANKFTQAANKIKDAAKKLGDALEDVIKKLNENVKDWIETKLSRNSDRTDAYRTQAESQYNNAAESDKYYKKTYSSITDEINDTVAAKKKYEQYADSVAKQVGLSDSLKKKVQNGTIDIQALSEDDKKRVEAYSQWYDKIIECTKAIAGLKEEQEGLYDKQFQNTMERYDAAAGKYSAKQEYYQALRDNRVAKGLSQYVNEDTGTGSVWYQQIGKERDYVLKEKATREKELAQLKKDAANYLKVKGNKKSDEAYQNMVSAMTQLSTDIINLDTAAVNLEQAMNDAKLQHLQWKVDSRDRAEGRHNALLEYKKVSDVKDHQITEADYQQSIKINTSQINALYALRAEYIKQYEKFVTSNNEKAQEYLEKIAGLDQDIIKNQAEIEENKNAIMELRLKPYYDAQKALADVIGVYANLNLGHMAH